MLRLHRILQSPRKNKNIIITKLDNGRGVVISDQKHYDNSIQKLISDISKFEKLDENPTLNHED